MELVRQQYSHLSEQRQELENAFHRLENGVEDVQAELSTIRNQEAKILSYLAVLLEIKSA